MRSASPAATRSLRVVYILPSRYDDEGYVLRYFRGVLPSNTLTCLRSLTLDAAESRVLGEDVSIHVDIYDDSVQRVPVDRIVRAARRRGEQLLVGFVGVQSNQFPRASDLALRFRGLGAQVIMGGFHVSGVLALFHEPSRELQTLIDAGVSLVRGEAEVAGVMEGILRDALDGQLKPIYDICESPDLTDAPVPRPDPDYMKRFVFKTMATIDTSRGCPFNCSFCTIINVQGRVMRHRSPERVLQTVRDNYAHGVTLYFFTDDNLSRNPVWPALFEGLAAMRAEGMDIHFMMQVDTQAWKLPGFIDQARAAGCHMVFVGMESINPDNIAAAGKRQNKVQDFAEMVAAWRSAGVLVEGAYIIGFPYDSVASVRRDIAVLKDEIKVDLAAFFMLTPLPGSRDHKNMVEARTPMDADLNSLDSFHETFRHGKIAAGEWRALYEEAWQTFYGKDHIVNLLMRTPRANYWHLFWLTMWNRYSALQHTHPMVTGLIRRKARMDRRPVFPKEGRLRFAWRRVKELSAHAALFVRLFFEFQEIWLLTRNTDDERVRILADLRARWALVQRRVTEFDLAGQRDLAMAEVRGMLETASKRLAETAESGRDMSRRARRKLAKKAGEIDAYLRTTEVPLPNWNHLAQADQFVRDRLLAGYEEMNVRYVASRRRFNEYRKEALRLLASGRILQLNLTPIPRLMIFEILVGARFLAAFILKA